MKRIALAALAAVVLLQSACTHTKQHAAADFRPPAGKYSVVVMRPDVNVSLLTAGGQLEPREDWTKQARANVLAELQRQQATRGGNVVIAHSANDANAADITLVTQLDRLHEAVGRSIRLHKYTPGMELPTKKNSFDWTLGQLAIDYGKASGYDYALFLFADGSFSSGGRVALQAVSMLGCVVGVCFVPAGGSQVAFVSLVDLKSGNVVWYNYLSTTLGDVRTTEGAQDLVENLLGNMKPGESIVKPKT